MKRIPVIAIFDIGKTNKKLLLFDDGYKLVFEESRPLEEITDEDGYACEDVLALTDWIRDAFSKLLENEIFEVKAVNFSAYGASFVYLDNDLNVFLPLYNYLKPYSAQLQKQFYDAYGGESLVTKQTASPLLGNLNSGMQLYRLKYEKPDIFERIRCALHLPQYLSYVLTSKLYSDITSIGCHTHLWNFQNHKYHHWVKQEGIESKLAPLLNCEAIAGYVTGIPVGGGLHDSSAALIPYRAAFREPFILLSTGTWCISINPFNHAQLSDYELHQDCLCYLSYHGKPFKASRLFAGYEHEHQIKKMAAHFNKSNDYYTKIIYNAACVDNLQWQNRPILHVDKVSKIAESSFSKRDLNEYETYEEAYHQFIADIITQQVRSTNLVLCGTNVKKIFVDGGFSKNSIYMHLLASAFPEKAVYAAALAQAPAIGAAMSIHTHWNSKPLPTNIIELRLYEK